MITDFKRAIAREWKDMVLLLNHIPSHVVALFCVSVVLMNLLANKSINTGLEWFALDGGLTISWLSFLCMDMIAKRFGAKASFQISLFAVFCNLIVCVILFAVASIPGDWSAFYTYGEPIINNALNDTFAGTWYVLAGSMIAFVVSAGANAVVNKAIGDKLTINNFKSFAIRSYVSTAFAQFIDNVVFSLIVSHVFFGWTLMQVITCSLTGAVVELLCEVVFSPWGYKIAKSWEDNNTSSAYVERLETGKM